MHLGALAVAILLVCAVPARAAERVSLNRLAGPVPAEVIEVIDGDTLAVRAQIWLGQEVQTLVRLYGVDAPELKGKCQRERAAARRAKQALADRLREGTVMLRDIRFEKYAGRVMSKVEADGADVGKALIADGYARPYWGKKRGGWCAG